MFCRPARPVRRKRPGRSIPRRQSAGWSSRADGRGDELRFPDEQRRWICCRANHGVHKSRSYNRFRGPRHRKFWPEQFCDFLCFIFHDYRQLGYETCLTREVAYDATHLRRLVDSMISVRLLLATGSSLLLCASLWLLDLPAIGWIVVLIQGINYSSSAIGLDCVYQGLQRMRIVAGRELFASLINVTGISVWSIRPAMR